MRWNYVSYIYSSKFFGLVGNFGLSFFLFAFVKVRTLYTHLLHFMLHMLVLQNEKTFAAAMRHLSCKPFWSPKRHWNAFFFGRMVVLNPSTICVCKAQNLLFSLQQCTSFSYSLQGNRIWISNYRVSHFCRLRDISICFYFFW